MKKAILLLTILFFGSLNLLAQKQIEPAEYAIYKIILEKLIITSDYKQIYIVNSTRGSESAYYLADNQEFSQLLKWDTRQNYNFRNQKPAAIENNFGLRLKVNLLTFDELLALFKNYEREGDSQKVFEKIRIPVEFSRVGFDKNKEQALIEIRTYCGSGVCGKGTYYLLSKRKDKWIIRREMRTWIS